jgi:hypothetical protein
MGKVDGIYHFSWSANLANVKSLNTRTDGWRSTVSAVSFVNATLSQTVWQLRQAFF